MVRTRSSVQSRLSAPESKQGQFRQENFRGAEAPHRGMRISARFARVEGEFEPKIFWREIFLEGVISFAISSRREASFIHSRVGSIHAEGVRRSRSIFSSSDFFSDMKRTTSREIVVALNILGDIDIGKAGRLRDSSATRSRNPDELTPMRFV